MPTKALTILKPDCCSAFWTAPTIDSTTSSGLTTTPFLMPRDGTMPTPMISRCSSGETSAISAQTLVVPTSTPTTILSLLIGQSSSSVVGAVSKGDVDHPGRGFVFCKIVAVRAQRFYLSFEVFAARAVEARPPALLGL